MKISSTQPSLNRANIDIRNKWEVRHWTKEWDVTKSELQRAIDKVGPTVHAIAKELRGNGHWLPEDRPLTNQLDDSPS